MDARYFNKYGDYLFKRIESKNFYARLGKIIIFSSSTLELNKDATKSDIKKSYFKLALIWHPDNIRKRYKYGFAHETIFIKLVAELFVLFEEAYKTLSNDESRLTYDLKSGNYSQNK
jgi:curved DNA-binding protein CbpA